MLIKKETPIPRRPSRSSKWRTWVLASSLSAASFGTSTTAAAQNKPATASSVAGDAELAPAPALGEGPPPSNQPVNLPKQTIPAEDIQAAQSSSNESAVTPEAQATKTADNAKPVSGPDAQASAEIREAAQRYDRGLVLYDEGAYDLAAIEFDRAYHLVPNYRALFNIGQVRLQLGDYVRAYRALRQYLREGAAEVPAERRTAVENDITMLLGRIAHVRLSVNIQGAEVVLDDVLVGRTPLTNELWVNAGRHRFEVKKSGYVTESVPLTVAGRDTLTLKLKLKKVQPSAPQIIVQQTGDDNRELWMWGTWSAAGVLALTSGITGGLGILAANKLENMRSRTQARRSELDAASRRANTLLVTGDILAGLSLVTGGVATYLTFGNSSPRENQPGRRSERSDLELRLKIGRIELSGTF